MRRSKPSEPRESFVNKTRDLGGGHKSRTKSGFIVPAVVCAWIRVERFYGTTSTILAPPSKVERRLTNHSGGNLGGGFFVFFLALYKAWSTLGISVLYSY